jgi:hypothetical protein
MLDHVAKVRGLQPTKIDPLLNMIKPDCFTTGAWFAQQHNETFFPSVTIEFHVSDTTRHHNVPLLLRPFDCSTYRGS